jgi:biotin carboxyl carrier protein
MKKRVMVDGEPVELATNGELSIECVEPNVWSVLSGGKSFEVYLKDGFALVEGQTFGVQVYDPRELSQAGEATGPAGRRDLLAPMPGKVIRVLVEVGAGVEAGQGILVVEAMKMQNEIPAPKRGRVVAIGVSAGDPVSTGQTLAAIE